MTREKELCQSDGTGSLADARIGVNSKDTCFVVERTIREVPIVSIEHAKRT